MLRVLYINNSGLFGGGERSLLELLKTFDRDVITPFFISPNGNVSERFEENNISSLSTIGISQFDNTLYSHYRKSRWLILLREIFYLPFTYRILKKAKKEWGKMDILHFNEITLLPAIILSKYVYSQTPIVIHVRSVQNNYKTFISRKIYSFLRKNNFHLIAIDESVKKSLPFKDLKVEIIHNSMNLNKLIIDLSKKPSEKEEQTLKLGYVGNFQRLKGIMELLKGFDLALKSGMNVKLYLVGHRATKTSIIRNILNFFQINQDLGMKVLDYINENRLSENIVMKDFTFDIAECYKDFDVLCFPSCLNACGRPVFEAAFFNIPSIVAINETKIDTIEHMKTGICISNNSPSTISEAIKFCYNNREKVIEMGKNAKKLAITNFDIQTASEKIINTYKIIAKK